MDVRVVPRSAAGAQAEAAQHEQRALAERAAGREDAQLDGGVVRVEEGADAPQAPAIGVELAVADEVHDDEAAGRGEALDLAAVGAQQLERRSDEAAVAQALAG